MTDLNELIGRAEALLRAGRFDAAVPLCEEIYVEITRQTRAAARRNNYILSIPDEEYMELYFGHSKRLGAYKIGISKKADVRARQLRSSSAATARARDFELFDCVSGPAAAVRTAEKRIKQRYSHAAVMGTEWISDRMDDAFDAYWLEREWLFEECIRMMQEFDPLAQLAREDAVIELLGGFRTADQRLAEIGRKIGLWNKEYANMLSLVGWARA